MRKIKCDEKMKIVGNWECGHMRQLISGLHGCLCNKENCYKLKMSRAEKAGMATAKAIIEMVHLMYQNNTAKNFYKGLMKTLNRRKE